MRSTPGAAMKATSTCSSPASMARGLPPWVRNITGSASAPRLTASATGPLM